MALGGLVGLAPSSPFACVSDDSGDRVGRGKGGKISYASTRTQIHQELLAAAWADCWWKGSLSTASCWEHWSRRYRANVP